MLDTPQAALSERRRVSRPKEPLLETPRLLLRRWESRDLIACVAMCRDPKVMQFFNGIKSPVDCLKDVERQEICFDTYGYGMWVVEERATGDFIGSVGIEPTMMLPKGMTARLSWKLAREFWGMNYGYEACVTVIDYAFDHLQVADVIAQIDPNNIRSVRLMQRLGLSWETAEDDFPKQNNALIL